jgi:ferrochelatase
MRTRNLPEFRFINHYHDHPGYIQALADKIRAHWAQHGRAEQLVMSFHGVPERTLQLGDPYHCECHKTARLLAQALNLSKDEYKVCFQSRFGKAKWLEPYTEPTVRELARQGCRSMQIVCPGFVSDCLETLEEIALEVKAAFLEEGGEQFHYIECINDSPVWIQALHSLSVTHMSGCHVSPPTKPITRPRDKQPWRWGPRTEVVIYFLKSQAAQKQLSQTAACWWICLALVQQGLRAPL